MKPLAIIGLDPGTTSAYAILDLEGNILKVHAAKELTLSEMIVQITNLCFPLIAGTDKAKVPSFVDEFARKVGAEIAAPPEDMKREEKRILLASKEIHYNGAHEQDAAAAALSAYHAYEPKLRKIEKFIAEHHLENHSYEFIRMALREKLHFWMIKEILTRSSIESTVMQRAVLHHKITKKDFLALYGKLNQLRMEKKSLERKIQQLHEKIEELIKEKGSLSQKSTDFDRRVDYIMQFKEKRLHLQTKELQQQRDLISQLQQKIRELYSFITQTTKLQLVKKLPTLGFQEFEDHNIINIGRGDFVLVQDPQVYSQKVLELLQERGVVILSFRKPSKVISSTLVTAQVAAEDIALENDYFCLIKLPVIQQKTEKKNLVDKVVREYKDERR